MFTEDKNIVPIMIRNTHNYSIKILSDFKNINQLTIYPNQEMQAFVEIEEGMKPYFETIKDGNNKIQNFYVGMVDINF